MKRFYRDVATGSDGGGTSIRLDNRPVRTPARNILALRNASLAEAIADEWRAQGDEIQPRSMPMTGLANAAIDRVIPAPEPFAEALARYAESELLCYRAEEPLPLVARQRALWDPLLDWARDRYDVRFNLTAGVMHHPQPTATLIRLRNAMTSQSAWALAALSPIVTIGGSLVIALALCEQEIEPSSAFDTAHLDELWQEELWGADHFAQSARDLRRADFLAACRFLDLVR